MVTEILKNIDQKRDQEIKKIQKEKEEKILALKEKAKAKASLKKEEALAILRKENSEQIAEFLQKKNTKLDFILQEEKNKIIEEVWNEVEERIKKMPDESFEKIITYLVRFVPEDLEGEIESSERTTSVLKKALKGSKLKIKDGLKEEGFLVKTKSLDLDFRITEVLRQMREDLNPKIIKILF